MTAKKITLSLSVATDNEGAVEAIKGLLAAYLPSYMDNMSKEIKGFEYDLNIDGFDDLSDQEKSDLTLGVIKHNFGAYAMSMAQLGHIKAAYQYLDDLADDLWIAKPWK